MPREKYRIHEVAKDFGSTSKKVIEILEKISDEPKQHTTVLEDRELDYIFETTPYHLLFCIFYILAYLLFQK